MTDPDEPIFIGQEDGAGVYVSRKNLSGVDHIMQRDHINREINERMAQALWDMKQKETKQ